MKVLIICATEYQLMNAINIKYHMMPQDDVDIIIEIHHKWCKPGYNKSLAHNVAAENLFHHVCYRLDDEMGIHEYFRAVTQKWEQRCNFFTALKDSIKKAYSKAVHQDGNVSFGDIIHGFHELDLSSYDQILAQRNDDFVNWLYSYTKSNNYPCSWYIMDEGIGAYCVDDVAGENTPVVGAYLYEPDLAVAYTKNEKLIQVPKLNADEKDFIAILNRAFQYDPKNEHPIDNMIVIFDYPSDPMPNYLRNANAITRLFLRNAYKKHLPHQRRYEHKMSVYRKIFEMFQDREIWIKFHPSTNESLLHDYDSYKNVHVMNIGHVPWELYVCNHKVTHSALVSVCSSAVYLLDYTIKTDGTNKKILLSHMDEFREDFVDDLEERKILDPKWESFNKKENFFIKDISDLQRVFDK